MKVESKTRNFISITIPHDQIAELLKKQGFITGTNLHNVQLVPNGTEYTFDIPDLSIKVSEMTNGTYIGRTINILKSKGIETVSDLIMYSEEDFKKMPGIGKETIRDIKTFLNQFGLKLKDVE